MDEAGEVDGSAIIARGEAPEMFEAAKASFDLVAVLIGGFVVGDEDLAVSLGWDDRLGLHASNQFAQAIAVIGFIGEYRIGLLPFQEVGSSRDIMRLASRDPEAQWPSQRVGQHVDLGRQSTSGTPQRLILGPPFPVAACWWARTIVLSIMRYVLSRSAVSVSNIRSQTPA